MPSLHDLRLGIINNFPTLIKDAFDWKAKSPAPLLLNHDPSSDDEEKRLRAFIWSASEGMSSDGLDNLTTAMTHPAVITNKAQREQIKAITQRMLADLVRPFGIPRPRLVLSWSLDIF